MENKRFFFVIGMPRTRTAWMSVLLSQGDSICLHEGTKNFPTFAAYAAHLRSLPYAAVGDSNSTLVFNIQELLEEFPDADIWFINRDHTEALESLIKTSPAMEIAVRGMWPAYCAAWESAKDYCFEKDRHYNFGGWEMLRDIHFCRALYGSCTGNAIGAEKVKALQDLRITAMAEAPASVPPPQFPPVDHSGAGLSVESLADAGCDLSGLTVQQIQLSDLKMIAGWWKDHDDVGMLPEKLLPPLGVLVSVRDVF